MGDLQDAIADLLVKDELRILCNRSKRFREGEPTFGAVTGELVDEFLTIVIGDPQLDGVRFGGTFGGSGLARPRRRPQRGYF